MTLIINIDTRARIISVTRTFYIDNDHHTNNDAEFERKHPRDSDGRFGSGSGDREYSNISHPIQKKIDSVQIDFEKDNVLPKLNKAEIDELGYVANKPVLLKKSVIERNLTEHPDVLKSDYNKMIGTALYNPDIVLPGNSEKPYFNFIARTNMEKSSIVLLEVACDKNNCEIVHVHWAKNKQRKSLERKGERIKQEKS